MTIKLIYRNMSRSIKDYAIYFLTICLAVSMFYAFNSITSQPAMGDLSKSMAFWGERLTGYISVLSKFITVILAGLILYANQFILKRRSKELAIYTTLGMPQRRILGIFVGETVFVGAAALAIGIGVGIYLSQALSALAVQLFVGDVGALTFVFSFTAVKETLITFALIYLAVALLSARSMMKIRLIDMLKQERINQEITLNNRILSAFCSIISIVCLGAGLYILMTKGIDRNSLWQTFGLISAGIILLFYSFATVCVTLAKKSVTFYYKGLNSFLIKQVSSKLKINIWVMATLTGLLILSITILGVGFSVTGAFNQKVSNEKVVDFSVMLDSKKGNPEEFIKEKGIDLSKYVEKSELLAIYSSPIEYIKLVQMEEKKLGKMDKVILDGTISLITETDYNNLLKLIGEEQIELAENEYLINANYEVILPYYEKLLKEGKEIELLGKTLSNKTTDILKLDFMVGLNKNNPGMLIVDDSVVEGMKLDRYIWNAKLLSKEAEEDLYEIINNKFVDMSVKDEIYYASKVVDDNIFVGVFGVIAFLCSYLGLILIIVTLAVLALQQLTEMQENKMRYLTLTKIGASKKMVQKTINKQIGIYFVTPLFPALLVSIFVVKAVLRKLEPFFGMKIGMNLVVSVAIMLVMYLIYYTVTCKMAQSIIIEKRVNQ